MYSTGGPTAAPAYAADLDNVKLCDSIAEAMTIKDPLPLNTNATYTSFYNSKFLFILYTGVSLSTGID